MTISKKDNNKINKILQDFEITNQKLKETIENLRKTQENMKESKKNFENYKLEMKKGFLNRASYLGIQTYQEKAQQLENQFVSCIISDQKDTETIIFDKVA